MVTPTKCTTNISFMSLWSFISNSMKSFLYLFFGFYFFGFDLTKANFFSALIILILTIISFSSVGIISASFVIFFKKGDPIAWLVSLFSSLFGGVFFPIKLLPKDFWIISNLLPMTYALRALRHALLQGYSCNMLLPEISALLISCLVLFPLSLVIFNYAIKKAKNAGNLGYY